MGREYLQIVWRFSLSYDETPENHYITQYTTSQNSIHPIK